MKHTGQAQIFCIAGDPGGADALAPVINALQRKDAVTVHLYAYYKAVDVFENRELEYKTLPPTLSGREAAKLLTDLEIDLLLTGTSANEFNLEKTMISAARENGVNSLALLDFWSNYALRFSKDKDDLECLPDQIAVMDQLAVDEMIAEGIPASRMTITGQPAFEGFRRASENFSSSDRLSVRRQFGGIKNARLVVFVSQPFSSLFDCEELGFDEKAIFSDLVETLDAISVDDDYLYTVAFFPHLRETQVWWPKVKSKKAQVVAASREDFIKIALASDLVAGMTSTKVVEAAWMGCRTISLQMGVQVSKVFDMARLGVDVVITEANGLEDQLRAVFLSKTPESENQPKPAEKYAIDQVVALVMSMLPKGDGGQVDRLVREDMV